MSRFTRQDVVDLRDAIKVIPLFPDPDAYAHRAASTTTFLKKRLGDLADRIETELSTALDTPTDIV